MNINAAGILTPSANKVSTFEHFNMIANADKTYMFKSTQTNKYIRVLSTDGNSMDCNGGPNDIGSKFIYTKYPNKSPNNKYTHNVTLKSVRSNKYVCADLNTYWPLQANRGAVGPWEFFLLD